MNNVYTLEQITPRLITELTTVDTNDIITFKLVDGEVDMIRRLAVLNLFLWRPLMEMNIPILTEHAHDFSDMSRNGFADAMTKLHDILFENGVNGDLLYDMVFGTIEEFNRFTMVAPVEYQSSVDISSLADIYLDENLKKLREEIYASEPNGIDAISKTYRHCAKQLIDYLADEDMITNNTLYPYHATKVLNTKQISQMFLAVGPRTDIDETVISKPIMESFTSGMKDIVDLCISSRDAVKVDLYNKMAVGKAQYMGKGVHLHCMVFEKVYPGSCGNPHWIKYKVRDSKNIVGKYVHLNGQEVLITNRNHKELLKEGDIIHMVSATTCRHTDGVCERCSGRLVSHYIPRSGNLGIHPGLISSTRLMEPVVQKILSAKHFLEVLSRVYKLNLELKTYFRMNKNEFFLTPQALSGMRETYLGFYKKDIYKSLGDIFTAERFERTMEERDSHITATFVRNKKTGSIQEFITEYDKIVPYLTVEMMEYIKQNQEKVLVEDGIVWVPMKDLCKNPRVLPIFRITIKNTSMLDYVTSVRSFITKDVARFRSIEDAMDTFSDILYAQVGNINIVHIETVLRASLITGDMDYRIPVVNDPLNVQFATQYDCISHRSIGCQLANERAYEWFQDPDTFLLPKISGMMDKFLNIGSL